MSAFKNSLRQHTIEAIKEALLTAEKAAEVAKETATHKENVAENKYDTLGLEASYLAHGQSQRVHELRQSLYAYESLAFKDFEADDNIDLTALVSLVADSGVSNMKKYFLIGPEMGGLKINYQQRDIVVITPQSPLGKQLMSKGLGDEVILLVDKSPVVFVVEGIV